ncbi:MAG TPA: DUF4010 domain-containing protein [Candidatus Limnocylindrales bacterium]|nr:DUF4010 domain-containing protein [Candidatus Limnocylindrales bacterium]
MLVRHGAGVNHTIDFVAHPDAALLRLLVAGLLGGLIGMERERTAHAGGERMFAGVRTFPLFALLGASLTVVTGEMGAAVVAGFMAVAGLALVSYWRTSSAENIGSTTESAALATYWIGAIAGAGALVLAAAIGITIAVLLASKERLEAVPHAMSHEELRATLTLAVIAAVILPLLPDQGYGPWGVWNPRQLWTVVVLVCGLSFAAFLATRFWGAKRGILLSGILGGLASSTAITASFASQSRSMPGGATQLAVGAGLASTVMLIRIAVLTAVAGPGVLLYLWPFLAAAAMGGLVTAALLARRTKSAGVKESVLANPFRLREAIRFGIVFGLVLLAVEAARRYAAGWGIAAASGIAGLVDVDAITLSLSRMTAGGLPPERAAAGIAVAALANSAAKTGYAWRGAPAYRKGVALILGASFVAGLAAMLACGLRP